MKRRPKQPQAGRTPAPSAADAGAVVQINVWLLGVSPMIWRRVLVPTAATLRELHAVFQVAMGWEGIHLYQFWLRAARYGSWEVAARSPDVTLAAMRFREGALRYEPPLITFLLPPLDLPWGGTANLNALQQRRGGSTAWCRPRRRRTSC